MAVEEKTLKDLLNLNTIFEGSLVDKIKNVFATNVFIPEDINLINIKTYNYFTGFIKLIETFENRTEPDWILIIYIDKMFDDKRTYNNINTTLNNKNTFYNKIIKKNFKEDNLNNNIFKTKLNELLLLYKTYILYIKENSDNYKRIKIISYECTFLNNYKYLGHTSTFGSIIRFLPIFEDNVYEHIVCINVSHAISVFFFCEIKKWILQESTLIMTIGCSTYGDVYGNTLYDILYEQKIINKPLKYIQSDKLYGKYRLAAGLFGIKKHKVKIYDKEKYNNRCILFTKTMYLLIDAFKEYINGDRDIYTINPFSYGIDEFIITDVLFDILSNSEEDIKKYKKTNNKLLYLIGKEYDYDKNLLYKKIKNQIDMLNILFHNFYKKYKILHQNCKTLLLLLELENFNSNIFTIRRNITINITKKYNTYINTKILIKTPFINDVHRYIDVDTFITDKLIDEFNSVYSDMFITLLNSLDEKQPLLIVSEDDIITDSKYADVNIKLNINLLSQLEEIIKYYKNLNETDLLINIKDKQINSRKWDISYIDILLINPSIDDNIIYETKVKQYIIEIIQKYEIYKMCDIAQSIINELKSTLKSNEDALKSTNEALLGLLDFNFLEFKDILQTGGYNKNIYKKKISGKKKYIKTKTHINTNKSKLLKTKKLNNTHKIQV